MKYTIITGNAVKGFRALGIFDSNKRAFDYGSKDSAMIGDWSIMEIDEIEQPRSTKKEMIDMLIQNDLENCNDVKDLQELLHSFLLTGSKGYQNWDELDLRDEVVGRELI